jgi:iron complex outermembrane receptor protein
VAPPPLEPEAGRNLGAPWAVSSRRNTNLGLLLDWADPQGAALRGGLFYSERSGGRADFTALRYDAAGVLHTSVLSVDHELGGSWSGELALSYPVTLLGHRIDVLLAARGRSSRHLLGASEIYDLDRQPPWTSAARPSTAAAASDGELDVTHQYSGALGFETSLPAGVRVHAEVHPSRYTKSVTGPAGGSTRVQSDLLYNASLLWSPDGQTTLYASYARGLEGSGVAPQDAQNANAVLPAVLTREAEVGFRRSLGPNLRLIGSAFSVAKPRPGRDAANVYAFIGDVRHAGVELSLNGEIAQGTSMLAGVTIMRPRLSGPLVAAGLVGPRPVGIPSASAVFSIDHTFSRSPNTSVDAQLNWESGRTANLANSATTPGYALLNLGLRRRFSFGSSKAAFRLTIGNVTGSRGWVATPGGGFQTRPERTLRFALLMNGRD